MEISEGIEIVDLALYLKKFRALVIGDVHLGFEDVMNRQGILLPRFQYKDTVDRLERIFEEVKARLGSRKLGSRKKLAEIKLAEIIVNGDLKHEFGEITGQEWREILKFIDFLLVHCEKVVLIKGNHDIILQPIARKRSIEVQDHHVLGVPESSYSIYIAHGHKIPEDADFKKAKTIIIGNEHPAVTIREGARAELFKCFLKGKWKNKELIAMPSFNQITTGTDILKERLISPLLHTSLKDFEAFVVADRVYWFGKLKNLRTLMSCS